MTRSSYDISSALRQVIEIRERMAPMLELAEKTERYQRTIEKISHATDYAYQVARFMPPAFNENFMRQFEYASKIPPEIFRLNVLISNYGHAFEMLSKQPAYVRNAIWATAFEINKEMHRDGNHGEPTSICQKDLDLTFEIDPDDVEQEKVTILDKIKAMFPQFNLVNIPKEDIKFFVSMLMAVVFAFISHQDYIVQHHDAEVAHQDAETAHQDAIKQNEINEAVLNELKKQTKIQKQMLSSHKK